MFNFCEKCGQKVDAKTGLCPQCDQAILVKKKKMNKTARVGIAVVCCISIIAVGIFGSLRFFNKDNASDTSDKDNVSYAYGEYNAFMEGFTDVIVTDEKSAIEAVGSIANVLGIVDVEEEVKVVSVNNVDTDKYYHMQQYYKDIPVYGRTAVLSADKGNNATALTSNFISVADDISLEPTATQTELNKSVQKYFDNDSVTFSVDDSNLVLYQTENGDMVLCYEIIALNKRIVINANTAKILVATNLYVQDMVECEYKDGFFQGIKVSENNYLIGDEEKGFFVFNANYNPVIKMEENDGEINFYSVPENSLPMTSTDNYFGNDDSFAPEEYAKAVYMLNTLTSIANYFEDINAEQNTSAIVTLNDSFDPDNAFGGYDDIKNVTNATVPYEKESIITIFFGQELCTDIYGHLDTLGHEYMHGINHSYFKADKDESSAIDEGYADIFGELLESLMKKQDPNWIHGRRNMVNPNKYGSGNRYPASIKDLENAKTFMDDSGTLWYYTNTVTKSGTDYSHFASTIISHCAYLMWNGIDGTTERKLQQNELGELWYRSLMFLQDNADFSQCRNAVELSARAMLKNETITEEQYRTVVTAFEKVGIENATFTYTETVKNKFDLSVLSSEKTENVHFKLEVIKMPTIKVGPGLINNEMPKLVMEKTAITGRQSLELQDGTYVLRITDIDDEKNISQTINIKIVVDGDNVNAKDEVVVNSDFTDVIVVIMNEKTENDDEQNTDTPDEFLSPEAAVDIYMANKNIWMENPDYRPMQGYGYCLLDLDFDGVLELINSVNDGSGRFSYNKFYKINIEKQTVEEFQPENDQYYEIDYYYMKSESKLLKNNVDGSLFYLFANYFRDGATGGEISYLENYMKDGKIYAKEIFVEYWRYDRNTDEEIRGFTFSDEKVSKTEFEQKTNVFYSENKDMNLVWKCIEGRDFDKGTDSMQKQLLLDAYRSYSYDGFSFGSIETNSLSDKDISDFEEMIKETVYAWDNIEGFESDKIDWTYFDMMDSLYILCDYYFGYKEGYDWVRSDPKGLLSGSVDVFDVEKLEQLMKGMFNISFNDKIDGGYRFYIENNKLYIAPYEGGTLIYNESAQIIGIKAIENNKYAIKVRTIWRDETDIPISNFEEIYVFVAHLSMENSEKPWTIDKFTRDAAYFDEISGTELTLKEETKPVYTTKEIEDMVANYFNKNMYSDENPGVHVVFSNETKVINNICSMVVRFQGTYATVANVFVADVTVNMSTGEMSIQGADNTKILLY